MNYVVGRGDTLSGIAKKYGMDWRKLYEANKGAIGSNPNYLRVGTTLSLSGSPTTASAALSPEQQRAQRDLAGVKQIKPFGYKFEDLFSTDLQAADESSRGEAVAEYADKRKSTLSNLLQDYAARNLFRSGMRTTDQTRTNDQFDRAQNTLYQQLLNSRRGELEDRFKDIRTRYEEAARMGQSPNISTLLR